MKCPDCKYLRQESDTAPDWQCPACHKAYAKTGKAEPTWSRQELSTRNRAFLDRVSKQRQAESPRYMPLYGLLVLGLAILLLANLEQTGDGLIGSICLLGSFAVSFLLWRMFTLGRYYVGWISHGDGTRKGSPYWFYFHVTYLAIIAAVALVYGLYRLAGGFS